MFYMHLFGSAVHHSYAVGLPLSDAKEFAKDRSEASVVDRALVSFECASATTTLLSQGIIKSRMSCTIH